MKNIPTDIFNLKTVKLPVTQGSLIISEPFLNEEYFNHAVISMIDYNDDEGSMGVVLNNMTNYRLSMLIPEIDPRHDVPVYCGGPVSLDRLYFIHTLGEDIIAGASRYCHGMWVGGNFDDMISYINDGYNIEGSVRFFLGYTGWSPGQIETEIEQSVWAVAPSPGMTPDTDPSALLTIPSSKLWHRIVRAMGEPYRYWHLHPCDVHAN